MSSASAYVNTHLQKTVRCPGCGEIMLLELILAFGILSLYYARFLVLPTSRLCPAGGIYRVPAKTASSKGSPESAASVSIPTENAVTSGAPAEPHPGRPPTRARPQCVPRFTISWPLSYQQGAT